jgi:hypothetical protein
MSFTKTPGPSIARVETSVSYHEDGGSVCPLNDGSLFAELHSAIDWADVAARLLPRIRELSVRISTGTQFTLTEVFVVPLSPSRQVSG